ncbi:MAG: hypothetical protein KF715_01525 [Candidatus Didemnitutus sp.]|nr:hypothetical protein [Candidatus Didemnitutus sp.]
MVTSTNPLRPDTAPEPSSPVQAPSNRSIAIGLLCTLLFHVLLLCLAPLFPVEKFAGSHSNLDWVAKANRGKEFNFELAQPEPQPKQPDPFKFVETNPDAPENTPDKTNNYSNRNQQSAQQEKPTETDPENRPSIKGRDDIKNDSAIVSGDMARPQDGAAVTAMQNALENATPQAAQQARAEQIPLQGTEKIDGKSEDGVGSNISQSQSPSNNAAQFQEGAKNGKSATGGLTESPDVQEQRPKPKARPRLTQARPNVLQNRLAGVQNIGILGIDARWSEYGEYMQEFVEIVQASWYSILDESRIAPKSGTHVFVTFTLNAEGEVSVVNTEETAGKQGTYACTNALTMRQPYRKWTDQMIAVLGKQQTITFSFYYW